MKYAEMNARQQKAFRNVLHAGNDLIGGLENTLADYSEGTEEYKRAKEALADHDGLVEDLYNMATTAIYDDGLCIFNKQAESYLKDIRFCGKEWLMERCDRRIKKLGY